MSRASHSCPCMHTLMTVPQGGSAAHPPPRESERPECPRKGEYRNGTRYALQAVLVASRYNVSTHAAAPGGGEGGRVTCRAGA